MGTRVSPLSALTAPQAQGRASFAPQAKRGPEVPDRYHLATSSPVIARACESTARITRGSSSQPKPINARRRLPVRQWMTREDGGGPAPATPEAPKPPFWAWLCDMTYSQARRTAFIAGIGSELVEEDELPHRAAVFRRIAGARLLPVTVRRQGGRGWKQSDRQPLPARRLAATSGSSAWPIEQLPQDQMSNRPDLPFRAASRAGPPEELPVQPADASIGSSYGAGRR